MGIELHASLAPNTRHVVGYRLPKCFPLVAALGIRETLSDIQLDG